MSDLETATRAEMERVARGLEALRERLQRICSSLPASEREDVRDTGEEDFDFPTEVRAGIECVLTDSIGPAIRALRESAGPPPPSPSRARRRSPGEGKGSPREGSESPARGGHS